MASEQNAVHLWLTGKRVVDFLLMLIELFRTAEALRTKINRISAFSKERSHWPKISGTRCRFPPTILPARKLDEWVFYKVYESWQ